MDALRRAVLGLDPYPPYIPTGELDYRRAERSPAQAWPESQALTELTWHWADFVITHRPFDCEID